MLRFAALDEAPPLGALGKALRHTRAALSIRAASGLPYTPIKDFNGGVGNDDRLERNSGRMPSTVRFDFRAEKDLRLANMRYTFFLDIRNLFDRKNCIQVFESTGDCLGGTEDQARRSTSNGFQGTAPSTTFDRPHFLDTRREINAGLRVTF